MNHSHPERRTFLRMLIHGLGALFAAVFGLPLFAYLIDARNRPSPKQGLRVVEGIRLSELPVNIPVQGVIRDVRHDGWTLHPNDVIGRVWVVRTATGPIDAANVKSKLVVFTTVCPHLGCSINHTGAGFTCPCHQAQFNGSGIAVRPPGQINPAPRDMDTLPDFAVGDDPEVLLVTYQNFVTGEATKVVRG